MPTLANVGTLTDQIGRAICEARSARGWTQKQLIEHVNTARKERMGGVRVRALSAETISRIENGGNANLDTIEEIALALSVDTRLYFAPAQLSPSRVGESQLDYPALQPKSSSGGPPPVSPNPFALLASLSDACLRAADTSAERSHVHAMLEDLAVAFAAAADPTLGRREAAKEHVRTIRARRHGGAG